MVVEVIHNVGYGLVAQFVSLAVNTAAFDATAGQPHAEAVRVVVPTDVLFILNHRQTSHFTAPVNQRRIEQPALFQILHKRGCRLIDATTDVRQARDDAAVMIPCLISGMQLHKPHAAFHQPARDQTPRAVFPSDFVVNAVQLLRCLRLFRDIHCLARRDLHPGRQVVTLHPSRKIMFSGMLQEVRLIDAPQVIQHPHLVRATQ